MVERVREVADWVEDSRAGVLVRVGGMGRIAALPSPGGVEVERGDRVVVVTRRGLEIGDVLGCVASGRGRGDSTEVEERIVRVATPEDEALAAGLADMSRARFEACEAYFLDGVWPIRLVDAETLLNGTTVLQYLGPHGLDTAGIGAALEERLSFGLAFEAVGLDLGEAGADGEGGCGSGCGTGGCGSGAGHGHESAGGCGTEVGCSSCALGRRKRGAAV